MPDLSVDFNARASTYDTATPIQSRVAEVLAECIIQHLSLSSGNQASKKSVWLDLGCGTGKLSQALLNKLNKLDKLNDKKAVSFMQNLQLYGIDTADTMLQQYHKNLSSFQSLISPPFSEKMPEIITRHADIAEFQRAFSPNSVDILMSNFALHWVTPDCVKNWTNLLTASGQIHVAIPVLGSLGAVQIRYPKLPIYAFPPAQDWQNALLALCHQSDQSQQRHGRVLYQEIRTFEYAYPNLRALLSALKTMGGNVRFNPSQNPLDTVTLRHYLKDNQPIALDYRVLLLGLEMR